MTTIIDGSVSNFVSVKAYGAVGDGVTNDGPSINAAIAAINATGQGGTLYFPPGDYMTTETIDIGFKFGITLLGASNPGASGTGSDIGSRITTNSAIDPLIDAGSSITFTMRNLGVINTGSTFVGDLVKLGQSGGGDSRETLIDNCTIGGVESNMTANSCLMLSKATDVAVRDTVFKYITKRAIHGKALGNSDYANSIQISRCKFEFVGSASYGAIQDPGQGWHIDTCVFEHNNSFGVYMLQCGVVAQGLKLTGNTIYQDAGSPTDTSTLIYLIAHGAEISGNYFQFDDVGIKFGEFSTFACEGVNIEGNHFECTQPFVTPPDKRYAMEFPSGAAIKSNAVSIGTNSYDDTNIVTRISHSVSTTDAYIDLNNAELATSNIVNKFCVDTSSLGPILGTNCLKSGSSSEKHISFERNASEIGYIAGTDGNISFNSGTANIKVDGALSTITASLPVKLPSYSVTSLPSEVTHDDGVIMVPDDIGGTTLAYADGTNWRRVRDGQKPTLSHYTLTGPGAVSLDKSTTLIVTTGTDALTLADGREEQELWLLMTTDGGTGTLTPSNLYNGTTITFDDVGDSAYLKFLNGKWVYFGGTATLA